MKQQAGNLVISPEPKVEYIHDGEKWLPMHSEEGQRIYQETWSSKAPQNLLEIERLRTVNAALLEALNELLPACRHPDWDYWLSRGDERASGPIERAIGVIRQTEEGA